MRKIDKLPDEDLVEFAGNIKNYILNECKFHETTTIDEDVGGYLIICRNGTWILLNSEDQSGFVWMGPKMRYNAIDWMSYWDLRCNQRSLAEAYKISGTPSEDAPEYDPVRILKIYKGFDDVWGMMVRHNKSEGFFTDPERYKKYL